MRERVTVSLDKRMAARVRQCGAQHRGGASGYLERLIREDEMREAVAAMGRWYAANPDFVEASQAERDAMEAELYENGSA